ncbi:hypothetical protein D3C71_1870860 [compost metagenome]
MQIELEVQAFRRAFLDEIGVAHARFDGADEGQSILRGAGCQALFLQRRPGIGDALAQGLFGAGRRIPGDHVQAMGQGAGDPAAADHAATQGGEGFDFSDKGHS